MTMEPDIADLSPDQLLAAFLDACRDKDQEMATEMIHELRYRVWAGSPLPRDVRPDPNEQAEQRRISALWRADRAKQLGGGDRQLLHDEAKSVPTQSFDAWLRDQLVENDREDVEQLIEQGWTWADALAFVKDNSREGGGDDA